MSEKEQMEFDLRMRSLLEDAEAKPSRRVWKAVSARLDEADAAKAAGAASWGWMKWAGASLALAAALAAGFFFTGTVDKTPETLPIPTSKHIQQQPQKLLAQAVTAEPAVSSAITSKKAVKTAKVEEDAAVGTPYSEETPVAVFAAEQETVPETLTGAPAAKPADVPAKVYEAPEQRVTWEQILAEDDIKSDTRPVQFFIEGALAGNESEFSADKTVGYMAPAAHNVPKTGITELGDSSYGIPFTVGIGFRYYINNRLSIATGFDYSLLTRSFEGKYTEISTGGEPDFTTTGNVWHAMHYIGLPVNLYYDIVSGNRIKFYAYGGGSAEFCVANKYTMASQNVNWHDPVEGLQWSVGAGVGVEFKLTDLLGIYVDPGARYYFDCNQPSNVRTEHPLLVNFNAGLRFDF